MSALDQILNDVASAAVAGCGSLDIPAALENVDAARSELVDLRDENWKIVRRSTERVMEIAALRARLALADRLADEADSVASRRYRDNSVHYDWVSDLDPLADAVAAYLAAFNATTKVNSNG